MRLFTESPVREVTSLHSTVTLMIKFSFPSEPNPCDPNPCSINQQCTASSTTKFHAPVPAMQIHVQSTSSAPLPQRRNFHAPVPVTQTHVQLTSSAPLPQQRNIHAPVPVMQIHVQSTNSAPPPQRRSLHVPVPVMQIHVQSTSSAPPPQRRSLPVPVHVMQIPVTPMKRACRPHLLSTDVIQVRLLELKLHSHSTTKILKMEKWSWYIESGFSNQSKVEFCHLKNVQTASGRELGGLF